MSYAITIGTTSWRRVSGPGDIQPGEVYAASIYAKDDGVWDEVAQSIVAPTEQQKLDARRAAVIEQINTEASRRILASYPLEKQSSANLGIYPQAYTDKMIADIASVIQASNDACDAVLAAVDIAGVEAVTVNWPVIGV